MRKKILVSLAVLLVSTALLLPILALDTHALLLRDWERMTFLPADAWAAVVSDPRVLKFYLLYLAAMTLGLFGVLAQGSSLKYRSKMRYVTPDIVTPCADGQGQFGTARWLSPKQFSKYFSTWNVSLSDLDVLLQAGQQDREEIAHGKK